MKSHSERTFERVDAVTNRASDAGMSYVHFSHIVDLARKECDSVEGLLDYLGDQVAKWVSKQES